MIINKHTNSDGEAYYSTLNATDAMIYSFTEDFDIIWDQATEDEDEAEQEAQEMITINRALKEARAQARAHLTAQAREAAEAARTAARTAAAEAARTAAAEAAARAEAWTDVEIEVRAINPHLTAREAQEAEARRVVWVKAEARDAQEAEALRVAAFAEAAEAQAAPEFWIIDLYHPTESLGEFPASGPYPSQAAAEKYIISDTRAIWEESCTFSTRPLKIVQVIRTVQPEVTATVSLVDSH
jgi:hypothetical protein